MSNIMEAIVAVAALAAAFAVYRLERKHDALVRHVLDLEDRLRVLLPNGYKNND
jgi:hypothetical protein